MRSTTLLIVILSLLLLGVYGVTRISNSEWERAMSTVQLEDHLMALDREFDEATAARGIDGWVEYFAPDGKMLPAGGNVIQGHEAIRALMGPSFADPNFSLRWEPVYAEVSGSGDLGYTHGTFVVSHHDPDGNPVKSYGKYVSIWRKEADGSWKIVADLGTPSPAPDAE